MRYYDDYDYTYATRFGRYKDETKLKDNSRKQELDKLFKDKSNVEKQIKHLEEKYNVIMDQLEQLDLELEGLEMQIWEFEHE